MSEEQLQARASTKSVRLSPRKARLVIDQIRGMQVAQALAILENNRLVVKEAFIDEGPTLKRFRPRAMGRATPINKPTSHITIVVAQA